MDSERESNVEHICEHLSQQHILSDQSATEEQVENGYDTRDKGGSMKVPTEDTAREQQSPDQGKEQYPNYEAPLVIVGPEDHLVENGKASPTVDSSVQGEHGDNTRPLIDTNGSPTKKSSKVATKGDGTCSPPSAVPVSSEGYNDPPDIEDYFPKTAFCRGPNANKFSARYLHLSKWEKEKEVFTIKLEYWTAVLNSGKVADANYTEHIKQLLKQLRWLRGNVWNGDAGSTVPPEMLWYARKDEMRTLELFILSKPSLIGWNINDVRKQIDVSKRSLEIAGDDPKSKSSDEAVLIDGDTADNDIGGDSESKPQNEAALNDGDMAETDVKNGSDSNPHDELTLVDTGIVMTDVKDDFEDGLQEEADGDTGGTITKKDGNSESEDEVSVVNTTEDDVVVEDLGHKNSTILLITMLARRWLSLREKLNGRSTNELSEAIEAYSKELYDFCDLIAAPETPLSMRQYKALVAKGEELKNSLVEFGFGDMCKNVGMAEVINTISALKDIVPSPPPSEDSTDSGNSASNGRASSLHTDGTSSCQSDKIKKQPLGAAVLSDEGEESKTKTEAVRCLGGRQQKECLKRSATSADASAAVADVPIENKRSRRHSRSPARCRCEIGGKVVREEGKPRSQETSPNAGFSHGPTASFQMEAEQRGTPPTVKKTPKQATWAVENKFANVVEIQPKIEYRMDRRGVMHETKTHVMLFNDGRRQNTTKRIYEKWLTYCEEQLSTVDNSNAEVNPSVVTEMPQNDGEMVSPLDVSEDQVESGQPEEIEASREIDVAPHQQQNLPVVIRGEVPQEIGGTYASPIIFPPQMAIVALGKMQRVPRVADNGNVEVTNVVKLSFAADHRFIDGATVARFSNAFKMYVEKPNMMAAELA